MLDKRLYRDASDLLELSVSDDKIVRILLVRGYTTEQIKRAIKEIRSEGGGQREHRHQVQAPITETIETGPSKRFGFLNKIFGKGGTEEEILEEEAKRLTEEEDKLKEEEQKIRDDLKKVIDRTQEIEENKSSIPKDVKYVLQMVDELLGKLPDKDVKKFVESPQFAQYKKVMKKYGT